MLTMLEEESRTRDAINASKRDYAPTELEDVSSSSSTGSGAFGAPLRGVPYRRMQDRQ